MNELGFVHQDIKADNILLKGTRAKVTDFTLAVCLKNQAEQDAVHPSIFNKIIVPPEVKEAKGLFFQSDTWQMGYLLYFLYTVEDLPSELDKDVAKSLMGDEAYDLFL